MTDTKKNNKEFLYIAVTLIIMVVFWFPPPILALTSSGMRILGILFGMIFGCAFCASPAWPCLMGMFCMILAGVADAKTIFATGLGNDCIWLMLFFFVITAVLQRSGVTEILANWLLSFKIVKGRPWVYTFVLIFGTYLIGMTGLSFPAMIIFWGVLITTCKRYDVKPFSPYPAIGFIGIAVGGLGSSALWLFKGNPLFINAMMTQMSQGVYSFNTATYAVYSFIIFMSIFLLFVVVPKFILRIDVSKMANIESSAEAGMKLSKQQKVVLFYTLAIIAIYCAISIVSPRSALGAYLSAFGVSFPTVLIIVLMCITKVDGEFICDFPKDAKEGVDWNTIILSGSLLSISTIMMTTNTGVAESILQVLTPIIAGHGIVIVTIVIVVVAVILTNFMANTTVGLMFTPVILTLAGSMGFNPIPIIAILSMAIQLAFITPAASPFAAMLFGYSKDWVKRSDLFKYGSISVVFMVVLLLVIGIPAGNIILV